MNTREAALKWGDSTSKIAKYCKEGFVEGARKVSGQWVIPDNAIRPLYFKPNPKTATQSGKKALILQAIDSERTIPDNKISDDPTR